IDAIDGAVGAAPTERADGVHAVRAVAIRGLEAEAEAQPRGRVERADLIARHQIDGPRREDANVAERAPVADHLEETRVVASRGQQPGAAREASLRPVDVV